RHLAEVERPRHLPQIDPLEVRGEGELRIAGEDLLAGDPAHLHVASEETDLSSSFDPERLRREAHPREVAVERTPERGKPEATRHLLEAQLGEQDPRFQVSRGAQDVDELELFEAEIAAEERNG